MLLCKAGGEVVKKKYIAVVVFCAAAVLLICAGLGANALLTNCIESINIVCKDQRFSSAEEAIQALEASERETNSTSLDVCPPYQLLYTFDYDKNTIVFYSYCYSFDGKESTSYAVRVLKHNDDGTLSFDSGFADFYLREPEGSESYYYFTNIETSEGHRSISFLYLSEDSDKEIYVDGIKAEKMLVSIKDHEFYICYAISNRDTFLSNLFTSISDRHKIVIE